MASSVSSFEKKRSQRTWTLSLEKIFKFRRKRSESNAPKLQLGRSQNEPTKAYPPTPSAQWDDSAHAMDFDPRQTANSVGHHTRQQRPRHHHTATRPHSVALTPSHTVYDGQYSAGEDMDANGNIFSAISPDKLTVSKSTVLRHHQVYASRNSLNSQSIHNLTSIAHQRPIRPHRKSRQTSASLSSNPQVVRREKPARPNSSKPVLSERAWRYSSQLSIRCSMPNGLHDSGRNSYSPREMAVDVEFHRQEEQRWKRHSIAATFDPAESAFPKSPLPDDGSPKTTTRPTSMMVDENIPEHDGDETDDTSSIENRAPADNRNNNHQHYHNRNRDHLCRRKSKSISNFGDQVLNPRSEFKYATVTPPSGWAEQQNSLSSDGVPCSDKPSRKFVKFDEGFESANLLEAEALWDYTSWNEEELTFNAGDVIMVIENSDSNWWWGSTNNHIAWFPASFVRLRVNQSKDMGRDDSSTSETPKQMKRRVREKVVQEIIQSERDYVRHLKDVLNGYVIACEERTDLFTEEDIHTIFGNLKDICSFQQVLLDELETTCKDGMNISAISSVFTRNGANFEIYSTYCNNHPAACNKLQSFREIMKYRLFFEKCRLSQNMIEIDLAGFLLTPIQRICKYPLQLQELLKTYDKEDETFAQVENALATMKRLANVINERKRKYEERAKIIKWQNSCQHWRGPSILEHSTKLIHSSEVVRSIGGRRETRVGYIFDGQVLLVKPDNLRKHQCFYRERIDLFYAQVQLRNHYVEVLLMDESDVELLRISLSFKKESEKQKWFQLLESECCRLTSSPAASRTNYHDFERERPKSAVMRESRLNRDSLKASWSAKRSSFTSFIKNLSFENDVFQ